MIWYSMVWYYIVGYDIVLYYIVGYDMIWCTKIWYIIWYILLQLGSHPLAVAQYTFTLKQYRERHKTNNTQNNKKYIEQYKNT